MSTTRKVSRRIVAAARAKAATQRNEYSISPLPKLPGAFFVQHINDAKRRYVVDTTFHHCTCPAFAKQGFCKHYAFLQADRREEIELAIRAEEWAEVEAAKIDYRYID